MYARSIFLKQTALLTMSNSSKCTYILINEKFTIQLLPPILTGVLML